MDYTDFQVHKIPPTAYYIPNFITFAEEQRVLQQVANTPKPKWTQLRNRRLINYGGIPHKNGMLAEPMPDWLQIFIEKVNNLGVFDNQKANHVLINEYLPGQGIFSHFDGPLYFPLVATISCGSYTILEFTKPQENEDELPTTSEAAEIAMSTSSSFDSDMIPTVEEYMDDANQSQSSNDPVLHKLILEPCSLLVLKDEMYKNYKHAISEKTNDVICDRVRNLENCAAKHKLGTHLTRDMRVSLTIRSVLKTTKMKLRTSLY